MEREGLTSLPSPYPPATARSLYFFSPFHVSSSSKKPLSAKSISSLLPLMRGRRAYKKQHEYNCTGRNDGAEV
jgi:hypothetical protein